MNPNQLFYPIVISSVITVSIFVGVCSIVFPFIYSLFEYLNNVSCNTMMWLNCISTIITNLYIFHIYMKMQQDELEHFAKITAENEMSLKEVEVEE